MKAQINPEHFFRMWPRALFHSKKGKSYLDIHLNSPGVYVLYREDQPYYIGKTSKRLVKRLAQHALRPNARRYHFWNYFSAFQIGDEEQRDKIEAILIAAMPTANSSRPKLPRKKLDRSIAGLLNDIQSQMLTGRPGETAPETTDDEEGEA
jgi:hypothetical protein